MTHLTRMLEATKQNVPAAADELLPLVYEELRKLATSRMAHEQADQTLQPTALVHEVWVKLAASRQSWSNRAHFFGAAAEAMRRILIDRARKRNRVRHGAGLTRVDIDSVELAATTDDETLLRLDEALIRLAEEAPDKAKLVKLRFFAGLTIADAARVIGISEASAKRHWSFARAWLYCELTQPAEHKKRC